MTTWSLSVWNGTRRTVGRLTISDTIVVKVVGNHLRYTLAVKEGSVGVRSVKPHLDLPDVLLKYHSDVPVKERVRCKTKYSYKIFWERRQCPP